MVRPLLEFCMSNLAMGAAEAKEILDEDRDLDVIEYGCLNNCGECGAALFAFVDGETVTGENARELVKNIYMYINEHSID